MTNNPTPIQVSLTWLNDATEELAQRVGTSEAERIVARFRSVVPAGYDEMNWPTTAALDFAAMEPLLDSSIADGASSLEVIHFAGDDDRTWRVRLYRKGQRMALADLLPLLANAGLRALDERSFRFDIDGVSLWVHDVGVAVPAEVTVDDDWALLKQVVGALLAGTVEADSLNSLVLHGGLQVRSIEILRAYSRYLRQINFPFSQTYIESVLIRHSAIAAMLVELFEARLDPRTLDDDGRRAADVTDRIAMALDAVPGLDDDRTIRALLTLIQATLRTNAFQVGPDGGHQPVLSFKFDTAKIPDLPLPRPMFEIWVCSPRVEGVHLRNGRIARGGIRWSDRPEDFRT
ncbi:MAG TPA: NAD-glutamate dehydrogenase, partial [Ilumatobacteraceae bacterium]|nr:NAD-glutamate dehydrogenase [Ilumatobacteraceae bacterium]